MYFFSTTNLKTETKFNIKMLSVLNMVVSSSVVFFILFYSLKLFKNVRNNIMQTNRAQEILIVFNMLKEDIYRSFHLVSEDGRIIMKGFLMSLSDEENDKDWGIITECSEGVSIVYNLTPRRFLWIWDGLKNMSLYIVQSRRKISSKIYEVTLNSCPPVGSLCFSNLYEVHWYSENKKIYREVMRNEGERVARSKFFVSRGEILTSEGKLTIRNEGFEISFELFSPSSLE